MVYNFVTAFCVALLALRQLINDVSAYHYVFVLLIMLLLAALHNEFII